HITDTDMASEMVKYTKASVLSQAGTAMLAQANQSSQGVLKLLG
ncbi:MAG: flagellin, partial [Acidobacteria bacterium]|nr:flagellin [Acidobacteriota bacterium]